MNVSFSSTPHVSMWRIERKNGVPLLNGDLVFSYKLFKFFEILFTAGFLTL